MAGPTRKPAFTACWKYWYCGLMDFGRICAQRSEQTIKPSATSLKPRQYGAAGGSQSRALRPILRWAGSKRKQLLRLSQFWRAGYLRYVEPFAGSSCLFFHIAPSHAILGDINEELMRFYKIVRASPRQIQARLRKLPRNAKTYRR